MFSGGGHGPDTALSYFGSVIFGTASGVSMEHSHAVSCIYSGVP